MTNRIATGPATNDPAATDHAIAGRVLTYIRCLLNLIIAALAAYIVTYSSVGSLTWNLITLPALLCIVGAVIGLIPRRWAMVVGAGFMFVAVIPWTIAGVLTMAATVLSFDAGQSDLDRGYSASNMLLMAAAVTFIGAIVNAITAGMQHRR